MAIKQIVKLNMWRRDNFTCVYCNSKASHSVELTLDHVIPKSKGGTNNQDNLVTSCRSCNQLKGSRSLLEFITTENIKVTRRIAELSEVFMSIKIKKFPNRKLYITKGQTEPAGYVNSAGLLSIIKKGKEVIVLDSKTGADITDSVLKSCLSLVDLKRDKLLELLRQ